MTVAWRARAAEATVVPASPVRFAAIQRLLQPTRVAESPCGTSPFAAFLIQAQANPGRRLRSGCPRPGCSVDLGGALSGRASQREHAVLETRRQSHSAAIRTCYRGNVTSTVCCLSSRENVSDFFFLPPASARRRSRCDLIAASPDLHEFVANLETSLRCDTVLGHNANGDAVVTELHTEHTTTTPRAATEATTHLHVLARQHLGQVRQPKRRRSRQPPTSGVGIPGSQRRRCRTACDACACSWHGLTVFQKKPGTPTAVNASWSLPIGVNAGISRMRNGISFDSVNTCSNATCNCGCISGMPAMPDR